MPTPESFKVPLDGWKLFKENSAQTSWINEDIPDAMMRRFGNQAPDDLPADYPNIESHRAMFEMLTPKMGGAVVSVDFLSVRNVEAFQTILKFRMSPDSLGMRYLGTLMFPFETFFCGFSFQCDEYGTTGIRTSLVYAVENQGEKIEPKPDGEEPIVVTSMDDFFDRIKKAPVTRNLSDDEKYDELVPNHPLTRVRKHLKWLAEVIEFDDDILDAKPYRGVQKQTKKGGFWNRFKRK